MKLFKYGETQDKKLQFTSKTGYINVPEVAYNNLSRFKALNQTENEIKTVAVKPINEEIISYVEEKSGAKFQKHDEEFIIRTEGENVVVYADDNAGVLYGLMTFLRLLDENSCFCYDYLLDYPESSLRGVKIYMPGYDEIDDYKALIEMMMYFRQNTIMIEIGGAMEYKRHPGINTCWEEYCRFMTEYPERALEIQNGTYPWRKDSIHCYNGGGSFLHQDTIKEIIEFTTARGIKIIPEVPSTSHCDYILNYRPDLAERAEDPYPDTFCPSNPESYEILFDIFDEIIDLFKPEIINVGHDEYYSINVCDRCRKRLMDASDIFAEDLTKIHDYLASKGVKTMFWCDKLQNVLSEDGMNFGGALNLVYKGWDPKKQLLGIIPATFEARNKIPKDIICLNWYWGFGEEHDEEIREFPVVFGNFRGENICGGFRKRCGKNTIGGMCSNWAATQPLFLQRNRVYFSIAYQNNLFWNGEYDDTDDKQFEEVCEQAFNDLFIFNYGPTASRGNKYIEVIHTTDRSERYMEFADGIYVIGDDQYDKDYYLGYYNIEFTDGSSEKAKIYMGEHIAAHNIQRYGDNSVEEQKDYPGIGGRLDCRVSEVALSTLPQMIGSKLYYKYLVKNPCPEKQIKSVDFVLADNADWQVEVKSVNY